MNKPSRKPNRLPRFDYTRNGAYFITVCSRDRETLFGTVGAAICRPQVTRSKIGQTVGTAILQIPNVYHSVTVQRYCIMPDHVQLLFMILAPDTDGRQVVAPTVSMIVGNMKRWVSKETGRNVWQKGFYDHAIRNEQDYVETMRYIDNNPASWIEKHGDPDTAY